eukprot:282354-Pelagomonas_calceolata.AAC.7
MATPSGCHPGSVLATKLARWFMTHCLRRLFSSWIVASKLLMRASHAANSDGVTLSLSVTCGSHASNCSAAQLHAGLAVHGSTDYCPSVRHADVGSQSLQ